MMYGRESVQTCDSDDGCIFICPIFSTAAWTKIEVGERQLTHLQLKLGYQKVNLWAPLSFLSPETATSQL